MDQSGKHRRKRGGDLQTVETGGGGAGGGVPKQKKRIERRRERVGLRQPGRSGWERVDPGAQQEEKPVRG